MATYALLKFKINNSFSEWEQAFYASQPMARKAGLIELFHGMSEEDPQTVHVLVHVHSKEAMDKFMQEAGEDIAKSGHILESTEVSCVFRGGRKETELTSTDITLSMMQKSRKNLLETCPEWPKALWRYRGVRLRMNCGYGKIVAFCGV